MNPEMRTWFAATRPAFLSVTVVGVLIGLACAIHDQSFRSPTLAVFTLLFALIAHAGANVINDYYDAINGCDAANTDRIAPFTGGSRFIQNGLLTEGQTRRFGYALLTIIIPAGIWLLNQSGPDLLWIGIAGLFSGWAYSATPLKLQSRGLGEMTIIIAWLMIVIGSDYVQSQTLSSSALFAGLAYAPLVANVLFVNQIPDRIADAAVGKNTLIVRWGAKAAPWCSLLLYAISATMLLLGIVQNVLPVWTLIALAAAIPAVITLRGLTTHVVDQTQLRKVIPATIFSCLLFGIGLSTALIL